MRKMNAKVKELGISAEQLEKELQLIVGAPAEGEAEAGAGSIYDDSIKDFEIGSILPGRVLSIIGGDVIVDVGYKSEGVVSLREFDNPAAVQPGTTIDVLLEAVEDDSGLVVLSKRKADRIRGWERVIAEHKEGDVVTGRVMRKIKGGLLVDMGVPVFLPASQINIRRPGDIAEYIGRDVTCTILKIDEERRNIVVSRRKLIEEQRVKMKQRLLLSMQPGERRIGVVKNIADFGGFVDLGGIDGLLHITDMSWGRISHPSEMLAIDQELEVVILNVNRPEEKVALGIKQKTASPWENIEDKYPVGSRVTGQVVNVMNYGGFVKLEEGIEGLVHISEMSWTRRINHPSEVVAIGDSIEVVVLDINKDKQEISLGMKQVEVNPWTLVQEKYPPGTIIEGRVRNLTNYGAFIEIEEGIDGLLHVSDMSWTKKISHPMEIVKKGQKVRAIVLSVEQDKKRVALGMKQLEEDPWDKLIPEKFHPGDIIKGTVTKITNFGAFVEIDEQLEGLLHISELSEDKVETPEDIIRVSDEIHVAVLRLDNDERKIGLSLKRVPPEYNQELFDREPIPPAPAPEEGQTAVADEAPPEDAAQEPSAETPEKPVEASEEPVEVSEKPAKVSEEPVEVSEKPVEEPEQSEDAPKEAADTAVEPPEATENAPEGEAKSEVEPPSS